MPIPFLGMAAGLGIKDYIIAGLAALLIALALNTYLKIDFLFFHIEGWKPRAERMEAQWKSAEDRLKVSNGSIDRLTKTIETLNAEANARAEAFEQSQQEARTEAEALERAAVRSGAQIASLRRLAARGGQCEVPGELNELLEGL